MRVLKLLMMVVAMAWAGSALAVEIPMNKPNPDRAALERSLQQQTELPPGKVQGFTHLPDEKAGLLIQPEGRTFRDVRTNIQPWFVAGLIAVAVGAMVLLYFVAGAMPYRADSAGRTIRRFTGFERFVHWLTAVSFLWLSFTGLNLVFGRYTLRHVMGDDLFAAMSGLLKLSHNSVGFAFMVGLVAMAVQWFGRNLPSRLDIAWFKALGGMFGGAHPPTAKFNAGQKIIYWVAVLGGIAVSVTGVLLLIPFYVLDIGGMQAMHIVHSAVAALMLAVVIGHIYLGSVGVPGSLQAMTTGRVDLGWAKTHHGLWVEEEVRAGRAPADVPGAPAE